MVSPKHDADADSSSADPDAGEDADQQPGEPDAEPQPDADVPDASPRTTSSSVTTPIKTPPVIPPPPRTGPDRAPKPPGAASPSSSSTSGGSRPRVAEPGSSQSKPRMPSIAVGPQIVRPGENQDPVLTALPEAVSGSAASESSGPRPGEPDSNASDGASRLPIPGMLRDDASLSVKEFRQARKTGSHRTAPPPPDAGVLPQAGVAPPDAGTPTEIDPADTDVLIASVADELIGIEATPADASAAGAAAVHEASTAKGFAPPPEPIALTPPSPPSSAAPATDDSGSRRWMLIAAGVVLVGFGAWVIWGGEPPAETPTRHADAADTAAKADGADDDARIAAAADGKAEASAARGSDDAQRGQGATQTTQPAQAADTGDRSDATGSGDGTRGASDTGVGDTGGTDASDSSDGSSGGPTTGELVDVAIDTGQAETGDAAVDDGASAPTPARPRGKTKKRKTTPAAPVTPPPSSAAAPPKNAKSLLADARKAYSQGKAGQAYTLAKQSHALSPSNSALETMALASCQRKDEGTARKLLKKLPLSRRSSVRERCRTFGVRLGL